MRQFLVTHKNGLEFNAPKNLGLDPDKIVKLHSKAGDGTAPSLIYYAELRNRRWEIDSYEINLLPATIITTMTVATLDIDIDKNNATFPITLSEKYIADMQDAEVIFQGGAAAAVKINLGRGDVGLDAVYALGTTLTALVGAPVVDP